MNRHTIVDQILKQRELKNERSVAIARFVFLAFTLILSVLAYHNITEFAPIPPQWGTLVLDASFFSFSVVVLVIAIRNIHSPILKFVTISLDFTFIAIMLLFDPSLSRDGGQIFWTSTLASLFLFYLNLLRFSRSGTIYAGLLALMMDVGINLHFSQGMMDKFAPMLISLVFFMLIGYYITDSNRKMMTEANTKQMMERYLSPQLVGELYKSSTSLEPGGVTQKVTILFSDIRSFTSISESLPPREVVTVLNDYLSTMTNVIFAHNGTIDKFVGDAIMTVFGAPLQSRDDALRAVRTAIRMRAALLDFNRTHPTLQNPLQIGIGIHTGEVIAGNIGSDKRIDYTVIGDNVNLSSRIEGLTKFYPCPVLISQSTYDEIQEVMESEPFHVREVDQVIVQGRTKAIRIYEVLPFNSEAEKNSLSSRLVKFQKGYQLYLDRHFAEAGAHFHLNTDDPLSKLYEIRCKQFLISPPNSDWDGVFMMRRK